MKTFLYLVAISVIGLSSNVMYSQTPVLHLVDGQSSPPATIQQFSWIAGHWTGHALGGKAEEVWTEPSSGSMMGSFKLSTEAEVIFYELCLLREVDGTVLFQLKHFGPDLVGWEEKNKTIDFPLVKITENIAFFDGVTFERISKDEIHLYVRIEEETESEVIQFKYYRHKNQ